MLYDQAQLALAYLEAAQATGDEFYATVAQDTIDYVLRDLRDPAGGFYSAEDADSVPPGEDPSSGHEAPARKIEGAFYVWTDREIEERLGGDAAIARRRFGIEPGGNAPQDPQGEFRGQNLLYVAQSIEDVARRSGVPADEVIAALARIRRTLFEARSARQRPHLDDKILTAWNGLMIAALARAARTVGDQAAAASSLEAARRAAGFIRERLWRDGDRTLLRFVDARNRGKAFLQLADEAWFLARDARPVRLSPGHRFAAGVGLQEILGPAPSRDYAIVDVTRPGGSGAMVSFDLRATKPGVPYPRVTYVVRAYTRRPARIELRLASGRVARLVELVAWAPDRRLTPAELVVKDLVGGQPPVRVTFTSIEDREPPPHLFALGTEGDRARAALAG
jgi:hypothetical protein